MKETNDLRIREIHELIPPLALHHFIKISEKAADVVEQARLDSHNILHGDDDRLMVIVGPCSIHDTKAAMEYAERLSVLKDELKDDLHIIMRVYFEKPRTSIGWKGLINDPELNNTFNINKGLSTARQLLLDLANAGMPSATEYLDLISPQYISDLVSWGAIGARTTESQGHRELASGVSCPIGFKNGTYGNMNIAVNAIAAANRPHRFLSVTKAGHSAIFTTGGNNDCHVILRGGREPNYDAASVADAVKQLDDDGLLSTVMIDFSHANSNKDFRNQAVVSDSVSQQIAEGNRSITGVMIESHLVEGNQKSDGLSLEELTYGQSITDACIGWDETDRMLKQLAEAVRQRRQA